MDGNITIPAGTRLASTGGKVVFASTQPRTLQRGQVRIDVPVRADVGFAGEAGLVPAGAITEMSQPVAGIDHVTNLDPTQRAAADETDDELRLRAKAALRSLGKATLAALDRAIRESRGTPVEFYDPGSPLAKRSEPGTVTVVVEAEPEIVDAACAFAEPWHATPQARADCLDRVAERMEARMPHLIGLIVREAGKTFANAIGEVREAVDFLRYYASQARGWSNDTHRPLGVVACISPWNFPLSIFTGQIAAALAAGNAVIAKPAEETPLTAAAMFGLLHATGIPPAALQFLPLSEAVAIGYAAPLAVVVLAALVLKERVRIYRWSAVTIGFVGVLIMLSPHLGAGSHQLGPGAAVGAALGLAGAFCSAFASVEVRLLTQTERTGAIVFYFMLLTSLLGLSTILLGWNVPTYQDAALMVVIGILGGLGQILIVQAYRYGDASLVAPFEYSTMLWAVAIGWFWFGEWPASTIVIGAFIVISSGIYVIFRERQLGLARQAQREVGPSRIT